ncbi:hypothetical protein PR202_gb03057 [Eleusine coracana subsp. coracana]|uniref:Uncharacterized protein n=1 Tax=Eleusine coracana subsp. coracana TaxID=191504 RepID=A0AAV5E0U9_ELECO|nr:hypothetical protein PR202_gb03057 [Eleusine coracana subsp. coracana]
MAPVVIVEVIDVAPLPPVWINDPPLHLRIPVPPYARQAVLRLQRRKSLSCLLRRLPLCSCRSRRSLSYRRGLPLHLQRTCRLRLCRRKARGSCRRSLALLRLPAYLAGLSCCRRLALSRYRCCRRLALDAIEPWLLTRETQEAGRECARAPRGSAMRVLSERVSGMSCCCRFEDGLLPHLLLCCRGVRSHRDPRTAAREELARVWIEPPARRRAVGLKPR